MMQKTLRITKINILLTSVIICISLVAVSLVYFPLAMGYKLYEVETGSMEPTIKVGSLIFVKPSDKISEYNVNDIVTFTDVENGQTFTHRVVEINEQSFMFTTKGDANESNDPTKTEFRHAVGKVVFHIPYVGKVAKVLRKLPMKIAIGIIYMAWAAIEIEIYLSERKKRNA